VNFIFDVNAIACRDFRIFSSSAMSGERFALRFFSAICASRNGDFAADFIFVGTSKIRLKVFQLPSSIAGNRTVKRIAPLN